MRKVRLAFMVLLAAHTVQAVATPKSNKEAIMAREPRYVAPTTRDRIGRVWAPVFINGKGPFRMVVDTGSNSSAIIPAVVRKLGISIRKSNRIELKGVTGTSSVPVILVDKIAIGNIVIDNGKLPVVPDVFGGADGVIGTRGWTDARILVDFRNDGIRVSRSQSEKAPAAFLRLPFTLTDDHLISIDIRVGSVSAKAILDTGAQKTIGNTPLRRALLLPSKEEKDATITGITLDIQRGESIVVPPVFLGSLEITDMPVIFSDVPIFEEWGLDREPVMLIGMDVIGVFDIIIIDYRLKEIQLGDAAKSFQ